jgi:mannose/cellobiose epimerase-like protein (N-acyl-D-glucosamine 2-epimerase family)
VTKTVEPTRAVRGLSHFVELARPLWTGTGLDKKARGFDKRLSFSGEPIKDVLCRLTVHAAQIVVYARASFSATLALANWRCLLSRAPAAAVDRRRKARGGCFPCCRIAGRPTV